MKAKLPSWENAAIAFALLLLLLLWVTALFPEKRLWGINHWAYFPLWLRTVVIAPAFFMFIPPLNKKLQAFFKTNVVRGFSFLVERRKPLGYLFMSIVSLLIFCLFRTKTHFLGDGIQLIAKINAGTLSFEWSQPLAVWIYQSSYDLFNRIFNLDGATVYALLSYLSGMIYVIFALRMAILLGKSSSARLFIFLILILMGSSQLFFGYAENYPLFYCGILIYLFYSLKYLRGETKIMVPTVIFLLLLPMHFFSLYLFPSILFLFLFREEEKTFAHILKSKKTWMVLLFLMILSAGLVLYIYKYNWYAFRYLVPLSQGYYTAPNYTMFSPPHILDFLNQQLLISPVGFTLFLIFMIRQPKSENTKDRAFQFLLIVSVGQLLLNFLLNPGLGAARDWDLFAGVGLGYTVLSLYLFSRIPPHPQVSYMKLSLIILAFLFTFPWILINAKPDMSIARFRNLLELDPKKSRNGHFILASYFDRMGKTEEVDIENRALMENFPEVYLANQGFSLLLKDSLDQAYSFFTRSIQTSPDFAEAHLGLGWYYFKTGNLQTSEFEIKKALEFKPDYPSAYVSLGDLYMQKGEYKKAEAFYLKSVNMGVDDPKVWNNLGILYAQLDNLDKAVSSYQRAIAKEKNLAQPHYGLACVYYQQGKLEESLKENNLLLQVNPHFALGYYQLGLTCESLGRKEEAISAYQRFLEMQPNDPKADLIRQSIEILRNK